MGIFHPPYKLGLCIIFKMQRCLEAFSLAPERDGLICRWKFFAEPSTPNGQKAAFAKLHAEASTGKRKSSDPLPAAEKRSRASEGHTDWIAKNARLIKQLEVSLSNWSKRQTHIFHLCYDLLRALLYVFVSHERISSRSIFKPTETFRFSLKLQ